MKKYSRILIIINLLLLLGYFNWAVYQKEQTLKNGELILLHLAPIDPRSLMQGDYMILNYAESRTELIEDDTPLQGYAILEKDSNSVGKIIRFQKATEPLYENEIALKYKLNYRRLTFSSESFFFEEGQGSVYSNAAYGGFRIDGKGESLLVGLYDENHQLLKPNK